MCTVTLSDYEALDIQDAETVLTAGEIKASEERTERRRLVLAPFGKNGQALKALQTAINKEERARKQIEDMPEQASGRPGGRVIVH